MLDAVDEAQRDLRAAVPLVEAGRTVCMHATRCPICDTDDADREIYAARFRPEDLNERVFSARRLPDRLHYRMVRCARCGLLRSNPVVSPGDLARLYEGSHYTYDAEAAYLGKTYARCVRRALPFLRERAHLLEIGCGSGFVLDQAIALGIREVSGVEPSVDAIGHASERVRGRIVQGLYGRDTFKPASFDIVCAFQVFDHVPSQGDLLDACRTHLKPEGVALFVNHDAGARLNRLLGEASPIIDIEHTALFDKGTARRIFQKHGFNVREVFSVWNTYPIHYWAHLAPFPRLFKPLLLGVLAWTKIGRIPLTLAAGNLGLIAEKA